jgi:malonyl-CoA O-methyltransferase
MNKELIRKNFSLYARYYDKYASVQNLCARKLIDRITLDGFRAILDVGCGTGNYTRFLKDKFPSARIRALDISPNMVEVAREKLGSGQIEFIVTDGEALDTGERFDLISSNATFQWFENLKETLLRYKGLLNERGVISFSIFGPDTFRELKCALKELYSEKVPLASSGFIGHDEIEGMLKGTFRKVGVTEEILTEEVDTLEELLRKIKYTGTRGGGLNGKGFWTRRRMAELEEIYRKKFGKLVVTYQVFFCQAAK